MNRLERQTSIGGQQQHLVRHDARREKEQMMYNNTTLGDLIDWLETQDQEMVVRHGFGMPHSDRGFYEELAFDPVDYATIRDMLRFAKMADGETFEGWKGGMFKMGRNTSVYIGAYGRCGEPITPTHFKYWRLTGGVDGL